METAQSNNQNDDLGFENDLKYPKLKSKGTLGFCDLMLNEVKFMYDVKKTGLKSFPKIIKNACSFELIEAITKHFEVSKKQLIRLEDVFTILEENPVPENCNSMKSLVRKVGDVTENTKFGTIRDAGIILAFHKIVLFEISAYTILSAFAQIIDEQQIIDLIEESLNESKVTELRLIKILSYLQLIPNEN